MNQDEKTPSWLAIFVSGLLMAAVLFVVGALVTRFVLSDGGVDWGTAAVIAAAGAFVQVISDIAKRNGWIPQSWQRRGGA